MEKDKPPQLVTPASVTAIISRIEAAQLTRAQEVISQMRKLSFHWGLMWRLGADPRFGHDSSCGPLGILGFSTSWVYKQITAKYPSPTLGLCKGAQSQIMSLLLPPFPNQSWAQERKSPWKPQDGPKTHKGGSQQGRRGGPELMIWGLFLATFQNPSSRALGAQENDQRLESPGSRTSSVFFCGRL